MIIARDLSFLFIAVPKTGSSSVEALLEPRADEELSGRWNKHVLAMKLRDELSPAIWSGAYKFAFVREPYSWMQSWYRYRQRAALKNPAHPHHHRYTGNLSFDEFVAGFRSGELMLRQCDFLTSKEGELLVDHVGRYEHLARDFSRVSDILGIENIPLPVRNQSPGADSGIAMSPDSRRIIREYFARDFELFDYAL